VKVLLGSTLTQNILLNTRNYSPYVKSLSKIILNASNTKFHITKLSLDIIHSLTSQSKSIKDADELVSYLESKFTICEASHSIIENARHLDLNIIEGIDLECASELGVDAVITEFPSKYIRKGLSIWSPKDFMERYNLNNLLIVSSSHSLPFNNQQRQLSLPLTVNQSPLKYMIRNTIHIIMKAIKILKSKGFGGLTKQELATRLGCSENTTQSIIWDLTKFKMADCFGGRVSINPHLLDTGNSDISEYLSIVLKDHAIAQEIYKEIKTYKSITKWRLQDIIATIYSRGEYTKEKSKSDYSSRIISWLTFAKVIEERRTGIFAIPSSESSLNIDYQNHSYEQLDLFQYQ